MPFLDGLKFVCCGDRKNCRWTKWTKLLLVFLADSSLTSLFEKTEQFLYLETFFGPRLENRSQKRLVYFIAREVVSQLWPDVWCLQTAQSPTIADSAKPKSDYRWQIKVWLMAADSSKSDDCRHLIVWWLQTAQSLAVADSAKPKSDDSWELKVWPMIADSSKSDDLQTARHKRLKERFLIRRNRTKRANFRGNPLFQATYNTTENS